MNNNINKLNKNEKLLKFFENLIKVKVFLMFFVLKNLILIISMAFLKKFKEYILY